MTAFGDVRTEFDRAADVVSWLDIEDDRAARTARTVVGDADRRAVLYLEAAADFREVVDLRAQQGTGGDDRLEAARERLETAQDHPVREASRLAGALSVDVE